MKPAIESRRARRLSAASRRSAQRGLTGQRVENLESRLVMDYAAAVLADNPIAFYRFDEAAGPTLVDSAPNGGAQNGTYAGAPIFNQPGAFSATGTSVRFDPGDGGDNATVAVPIGASFTVEVWARSATNPFNDFGWFASSRGANGFIMHPDGGGTNWSAYVVDGGGAFYQIGNFNPGAAITGFHQYVMTYDAPTGTGRMFFDGNVVATNFLPFAQTRAPLSNINIQLGKDDTGGRFGNGWLDDTAIYNYALSPAQVLGHFLTAQATFIIWTGAVNSNWNNAGNWTGGNIPDAFNEVAVFANAAPGTIDLQGNTFTIGGVEFSNTAGSFNVSNGTLNMTSTANSGTSTNTITANITATSAFGVASNNAGATLNLNGNLNLGDFDLNASGGGTVNIAGNILAGTSVSGRFVRVTNNNTGVARSLQFGEMEVFNEGVVPDHANFLSGNEIKGDSFEAEVGNVAHGANTAPYNDILDTGGATYNRDGVLQASYTLDLGASQTIGTVRMWQRVDGCCQDRLANYTVEVLADAAGFPGAVVASRNFPGQVATNSFGDVVFGSANHLTKNGTGTLILSGTNTYHGLTTVNEGTLVAASSGALGTTTVGATVAAGATLALNNNALIPAGESLVLGTGRGLNATLQSISGTNAFNGPIRLAGIDATIRSDAGTLTLGGNIAMGLSRLSVTGAGDVNIGGQISAAGPAARFVSIINNGVASRSLHVGEVEIFAAGVTPDNPTNLSSNEIAGAIPVFDSTSVAHGALANLINNTLDAGANVHTLNNSVNGEMGIFLSNPTQVGSIRVWQRQDGCCQERLSDFSLNLYADDGTGNPGALLQTQSFTGIPFTNGMAHLTFQEPTANKLVKYGTGTLTLSSATGNTYGGGTEIKGGTLLVNNTSGSATGPGPVQVGGNAEGRFVWVRADNGGSYEFAISELEVLLEGYNSPSANEVDGTAAVSLASRGASFESQVGSGGHGLVDSVYDGIRQVGGNTWDRVAVNPEYVLDLGTNREIGTVRVWQRADGCCQDRLQNFTVSILADNGSGLPGATLFSQNFPGQAATNSFAAINVSIPNTTTGALLGGSGSIAGAVTVLPGNRIDPGLTTLSPGTVATGNLTLSNTITSQFLLAPGGNDQVAVTGSVTLLANAAVALESPIAFSPPQNTAYVLINNDTEADPIVGTFSGVVEGLQFLFQNRVMELTYLYNSTLSQEGTGNDFAVLVRNRTPTAVANGPYTINEGSSLTVSAAGSSDPDLDPLTYRWDLDNDGDFDELITGVNPTVTPAQLLALGLGDGPQLGRTIRVEANDGFGGTHIATATLNINNVAPTASVSPASPNTVPGLPIDIDFSALDPSQADLLAGFRFTIDFGDGNTYLSAAPEGQNGNPITLSHTYNAPGNYTVTVRARDKDNALGPVASTTIQVSLVAQIGDDIVVGGQNNVNDKYIFSVDRNGGLKLRYQASNIVGSQYFGPMEPNPGGRFIIYGQSGNDTLTVPANVTYDFEFHGGAGNDTASGGLGNDTFYGDDGNDNLKPGGGDDYVEGGNGNDAIDAGAGNDTVLGDAGNDKLLGNSGDDVLIGGDNNDSLNGGLGLDLLFGEEGNDTLQGYHGNDVLVGGNGLDTLQGGNGDDILIGGDSADRMEGQGGVDILIGGSTIYDDAADPNNWLALTDLLAEWGGPDDYATRLDNLRTGGGLTNGNTLEMGNSVIDDGFIDKMIGGIGTDWFLGTLSDTTDRKLLEEQLN